MSQPTKADRELIDTVNAHLRQLEAAARYDVDEATLRATSPTLRALLSEGMLARAWRASKLSGRMTFTSSYIVSTGPGVVIFVGGGDFLPGQSFSCSSGPAKTEMRTLDLAGFCNQSRAYVGGEKFSTVDIVKYVANALGGSHYHPDGPTAKRYEILRQVEADEIRSMPVRVNDRSHLHHEILSIAQVVIRSPEIVRLRRWHPSRH